jgi:hypothetical protein
MPRDGSLILSDIREPTLTTLCKRCGRDGRHNVKRLIAAHGTDATLPYLLATLANCEKARSFRCLIARRCGEDVDDAVELPQTALAHRWWSYRIPSRSGALKLA